MTATAAGSAVLLFATGGTLWWLGRPAGVRPPCQCPWSLPDGDLTPMIARRVLQYHDGCPEECPARYLAHDILLATNRSRFE